MPDESEDARGREVQSAPLRGTQLSGTAFPQHVQQLESFWHPQAQPIDDQAQVPVFLDLLSGPRCPLARAFEWAGWKVLRPSDIATNPDIDVAEPSVQRAIGEVLPSVHLCAAAIDCGTKSKFREIPVSGTKRVSKPLRSPQFPRGVPNLKGREASRIATDNECSDFLLAAQHVLHVHGRGAMRENPGNSLHWFDTVEQYLEGTGAWSDFKYFACVFLTARRKFQVIRHNLASMQMLPFHQCGHIHDQHEWSPTIHDSGVSYPGAEEAEYSASLCFTLVVAASHWAVDKGYAVLRIQRLPPVQVSGDWRGLLKLPPQTLRKDAMSLMAAHVGLRPSPDSAIRVQVQDVWCRAEPLPADVVYIGHSHFSHRLPVTCWENPFVAGRDGSPELVVFKYMQWFRDSSLEQRLPELRGKKLACDCGAADLCHGDFLLGLMLPSTDASRHAEKPERVRCILLAAVAGLQIPGSVAYRVSQSSIVSAAQSLIQGRSRLSLRWPYIEDLVNSPHFTAFGDWLRERGLPDAGVLGPRALGSACVMAQRASAADQGAAANKRHALPPVVPYGQTADGHFARALDVQLHGCPLDWEAVVDHDVQFAAASMATDLARLRRTRADAMELLKELARRLSPVSQRLHAVQHPDVRSVNPHVHLALFAVCVVLLAWPDTSFVQGLLHGFPAVGYQEPCGVWQSKPARFCTLQDALSEGRRDAEAVVSSLRPSEDDQVVWEAGEKDEKAGFCHPSVGWQGLTAGPLFRVIRRFVVTQASGKKRVIDDALAGRQSEFSSDANKLQFCSAIQPCLHAQALAAELVRQGRSWPDTLATAGEDLPDAYRKIPMHPDHAWACVVAYHDCRAGGPRFRRYKGMLFGLPLAVSAFNRLPMFLQCVCRRLLRALVSMYFDDLTLQDWRSLAAETQAHVEELFELFGFPFSTEKRQEPAATGDFLGLMHDFLNCSRAPSGSGCVRG